MKICLKCGAEKPLSEYHAKRGKPQPQCKACRSKYMAKHYQENLEREKKLRKEWYEANKLRVSIKGKADRLANPDKFMLARKLLKYGLTREQYEAKLKKQGNACEICQRSFARTPYVDHCHNSLVVRGLLCSQCNTSLGLLKEDIAIFKRCIAYLRKYKK